MFDLTVHRPCPKQQLPVRRSRGGVERAGVHDHLAAHLTVQQRHVREPHVVADAEADLAVLRVCARVAQVGVGAAV